MADVVTNAGQSTAAPGVADVDQPTWPGLLGALIAGVDLSADQAAWAMEQVMSGTATPAQVAGYAVALRAKGETAAELAGMAATMLAHARRVDVSVAAVDVVGTGGDQAHTVNISTMAAVIAAAAGAPVVKHGNRAASSRCGAADLLEALGVVIELSPEAVATCVRELGIGFCFAPAFHPALRHAGGPRREIGVPTIFNFLGPLANPAQPTASLVGCADLRMAPLMADVLAGRGVTALVVRGDDGLDELTTTATNTVWVVDAGAVRIEQFDAATIGVPRAEPGALRGGEPAVNVEVTRQTLAGQPGAVRDAVLLNAGAALAVHAGLTGDLAKDVRAGMARAERAVDSGAATELLNRWIGRSVELS